MQDKCEAMLEAMEEAQQETDLKRQTSRKLKEEIIDNDRLTVANLNRIKSLEALLEQHKAALAEAEEENETLKEELAIKKHELKVLGKRPLETDPEEEATLQEAVASQIKRRRRCPNSTEAPITL